VRTLCSVSVSIVLFAGGFARAQQADAPSVLALARSALGGQGRIDAVKTLVATGRSRQLRGENLVPIEFELDLELPDKYIRRDEVPAQETGRTARGFNGSALIQFPAQTPGAGRGPDRPGGAAGRGGGPSGRSGPAGPPPGSIVTPPPDPVTAARQDFARLALGLFASSFDVYPVSFTYSGIAEAPEGSADVLAVTGAADFSGRLFISHQTRLPLMLSWPGPPTPAGPVENRLYYADFRSVDGLMLPFRIRRAVGANTTEEMSVDRYRVNSKVDPKKFEVRP
jgi:hypothetical protein